MAYDYQGAIKAGASKQDVLNYLGSLNNYDVNGAIQAGANEDDVLNYLSSMPNKGTPQEQEPVKKEGFLKRTARAILTPVATLAARPVQLVKALAGASEEEQAVNVPFIGKIETSRTGKDVIKDIGRGAETIALGVGGVGAKTALQTGIKGLIKEGAKIGAKEGLQAGALTGFGQGLQQASEEDPEKAFKTVFGSTALGAGLGLTTGAVFGGATPLAVKGVQKVKGFTNVQELENKLSSGFKTILNPNARQIKVDSRFGGDSFKFLAQEMPDMPIRVENGRLNTEDAIEMARQKYSAEATAYKPIIRKSGKYLDIDDVVSKAKAKAREEFDGSDLVKAERQIDDEVNAFLAQTPEDINVTPTGKRFVTLERADDIKSYSWSRGKGWGSPDAEVWNDTNNLIGHALKDAIEKELPGAPIKAMNKRLGQWKNAIDLLEKRNGQVAGRGGKISSYLLKSVGTLVGSSAGSDSVTGKVTGAGAGFMTASALAGIMSNPNVRLFVVRNLLKNLRKAGRNDMIKEAEQILSEESSKYLLPAVGQSSFKEVTRPTIISPKSFREQTLGLDEVRNSIVRTQPNHYQRDLK